MVSDRTNYIAFLVAEACRNLKEHGGGVLER